MIISKLLYNTLKESCDLESLEDLGLDNKFDNLIGWTFIGPLREAIPGNWIGVTNCNMWFDKFGISIRRVNKSSLVFVDYRCPEVYKLDYYSLIMDKLNEVVGEYCKKLEDGSYSFSDTIEAFISNFEGDIPYLATPTAPTANFGTSNYYIPNLTGICDNLFTPTSTFTKKVINKD